MWFFLQKSLLCPMKMLHPIANRYSIYHGKYTLKNPVGVEDSHPKLRKPRPRENIPQVHQNTNMIQDLWTINRWFVLGLGYVPGVCWSCFRNTHVEKLLSFTMPCLIFCSCLWCFAANGAKRCKPRGRLQGSWLHETWHFRECLKMIQKNQQICIYIYNVNVHVCIYI